MSLGTCGLFKDLAAEFEREEAQRLFEAWLGDDTRNSGVLIEQRIRDLFHLFSHPPIPNHLGFQLSASVPVHLIRLSMPPCFMSALVVASAVFCASVVSKTRTDTLFGANGWALVLNKSYFSPLTRGGLWKVKLDVVIENCCFLDILSAFDWRNCFFLFFRPTNTSQ